jgi:hypothetical protein
MKTDHKELIQEYLKSLSNSKFLGDVHTTRIINMCQVIGSLSEGIINVRNTIEQEHWDNNHKNLDKHIDKITDLSFQIESISNFLVDIISEDLYNLGFMLKHIKELQNSGSPVQITI